MASFIDSKDSGHARERQLLTEIGALSDRIRRLRATGVEPPTPIKALEAEARGKWDELRLVRAGPVTPVTSTARRAGYDL